MNTSTSTPAPEPEEAAGHYGAGYGEQVPEDAPPDLQPATDQTASARPSPAERRDDAVVADAVTTTQGDDRDAVDFTADDVQARPPDRTPTEAAPESEKAGLIFERS